jgi:hypothetical protein
MWVEIEDDDKPDICTCNPEDFEQGHLYRSAEEIYANAKLIAAAPTLLNALKVLTDVAERQGIPCDAARAAINYATEE